MFSQIINFIFAYLIIFWITLFCVLPFGVKREENPESGNDHGAPANAGVKKKFVVTAVIAFFVTMLYALLVAYGVIDWDRLGK